MPTIAMNVSNKNNFQPDNSHGHQLFLLILSIKLKLSFYDTSKGV